MPNAIKDEYYEQGYHTQRHAHLIENEEYFWARAEASSRFYFCPLEQEQRIFEFGCGIGQNIASLPNAAGWDISGEARAIASSKGIKVYDSLTEVPNQAWDIVFCRHVLEHVEHPLDSLRDMRKLVAPGGNLYLILPKENHSPAPFTPDLNQHLYTWNFRTINNLLHRAGFAPYHNSIKYLLGFRVLLPVRRVLGQSMYYHTARMVGRLYRNGELVIRARIS